MSPESEPQLIDAREFLAVVRRRKWSIALVTAVVAAVALTLVTVRTPVYDSAARVEVRPEFNTAQTTATPLINMDNESARVTSEPVAARAAKSLSVSVSSPQALRDFTAGISVSVPTNTTFLEITCSELSPELAQACAQAFAEAYRDERIQEAKDAYAAATEDARNRIADATARQQELQTQLSAATSDAERAEIQADLSAATEQIGTARLEILNVPTSAPNAATIALPAAQPLAPANKGFVTTGLLALILGLALGTGLGFLRERLDERVVVGEKLEQALGAPVLAAIPRVPGWRNRNEARSVTIDAPDSASAEAYRAARTSLMYLAKGTGLQIVELTGPGQTEGKTTTTANLGVALAQAGRHVIAVSCDLRRPRLHRFFGLDNAVGLSDVLNGRTGLGDVFARTAIPNLVVIPSGPVPPNPAELLGSSQMDDLLAKLRELADLILLDTPPALIVADALELAPKSDGIVLVADATTSTRGGIAHARLQLERVGGTIVGGILNAVDPNQPNGYASRYSGYYGNYRYRPEDLPTNGNGAETDGKRRKRRRSDKESAERTGFE